MTSKRKMEITVVDEIDRTMYSIFCNAASNLSQLYSQSLNLQKLAFQSGERHALEKLHEWMAMKHQEGVTLTIAELSAYLQNELDCGGEEVPMSPISQPHKQSSANLQFPFLAPNTQMQQGEFRPATGLLLGPGEVNMDQAENSVFSDALSGPVRRKLPLQMAPGQYYSGEGSQVNNESESRQNEMNTLDSNYFEYNQNRDGYSFYSLDSPMDSNPEGPPH
ncbi:hypothetical protein HHK36_017602 [Tetracentron sinense]|uniref:Uncharacterized protein n=1 Tax=Tetracentron sinense TaxID=13715 RepID=A0A834Z296_TETSI|nr:hypothetical protein HHK36_017602 [Tetracentron sinense]